MRLLTFTECHRLVEDAIECGLAEPGQRRLLIPDPGLRASLPELSRPRMQFVADLDELAMVSWPDDPHPLMTWLGRARDMAGSRKEAATFGKLHDEVAQRLGGPWGLRADPSWGPPAGVIAPVRLVAPIADHRPRITLDEVRDACRPAELPPGDHGLLMDLCGAGHPERAMAEQANAIALEVDGYLRYADGDRRLGIFGFAPIPLLISLGRAIGDKRKALVFERHRHTDDWRWGTVTPPAAQLSVEEELLPTPSGDAAILVSISDHVKQGAVQAALGGDFDVYSISAAQPRVNIIRTPSQLTDFSDRWRRVLNAAHGRVGHGGRVHVFAAAPLSVAVEMGRRLLPNADPALSVYDYRKGRFLPALDLDVAN